MSVSDPEIEEVPELGASGRRASAGRVSLLSAARRYWPIVLIPAVILCALGVFLASERPPNYTAEARVTVSSTSVDPAALGSFVVAANALAAGYSRAIDGEGVLQRVSDEVGISKSEAGTALNATPVPESPVLRIEATSDSEEKAVAIANSASDALIAYTAELNGTDEASERIFRDYRRASRRYEDARVVREEIAKRVRLNTASDEELARADARLNSARLRLDAIGAAYQAAQQGRGSTRLLQVLSRASTATSDRIAKMQIAGFVGLLAGLLIGLAGAMARARRLVQRGRV